MNKYKKLANNSLIITIGNIGSKLLVFLMLPLYTNVLTTSEYGTIDLITTIINFTIPYLTLELGQASLRYLMDSEYKKYKNQIFSNVTIHGIGIGLIIMILTLMMSLFIDYDYFFLIGLLIILYMFIEMYTNYIRGIGHVKEFAINGILMTIITVITNILFLVKMNLKVNGYLLSLIIASIVSVIYLLYIIQKTVKVDKFSFNKPLQRKLLSFSIPIVPNSTMWWLVNSSTRIFIVNFIGISANGLYAVASKIPSIISVVIGIFNQAWQISSFEEYESSDKDTFYSKIFRIYSSVLFLAGAGIIIILIPFMRVYVNEAFFLSWQIVPSLIIAVIYQSFTTFFGTIYTASKKTYGALQTSFIGAILSIGLNFLIIPKMGVQGAGIATAISFIFMFFHRVIDTHKYVQVMIDWKAFIYNNILLLLQIVFIFKLYGVTKYILQLIFLGLLLINNIQTISDILTLVKSYLKKQ